MTSAPPRIRRKSRIYLAYNVLPVLPAALLDAVHVARVCLATVHSASMLQTLVGVFDCRLLRGQSGQVLEDKMQLLNIVPVLRQVPIEAMRLMMLHATMREFAPGSLILNQDQEVGSTHLIG